MIGLILVVSAVPLSAVLVLHFWKGIAIGNLTRDPTGVAGAPLYTGFLSQIGIFFWAAAAAVCLFSVKVLPRQPDALEIKRFLVVSGLLTLVLGLDDVFLLHEKFLPNYVGVPENAVLVSYAGFVLFYLVRFYSVILETEYVLLGMALFFFGLSIIIDVTINVSIDVYIYEEDGAKLVGIVSWLAYFFRTGASAVCHDRVQ